MTLCPLPGEGGGAMLRRLGAVLRKNQATIVKLDIFGALRARPGILRALKQELGRIDWPTTWIEGEDCAGGRIAGMHVLAIHGTAVEAIQLGQRRVGSVFSDGSARHCFLGDLCADDVSQPPAEQCWQTYLDLEAALRIAGMDMSNLVRTWLFLDNILAWYDQFNQVRSKFYRQRRVLDHLVPASTGVGARNPAGAALMLGAWAVQSVNGSVAASEVASPRQCPAPTYGSCFSRAVELITPNHRHLLISGTASIEPGGRSAHHGDIDKQVDLTMQVVQGILESRGMSFRDVSRMTAYFKRSPDASAFSAWCAKHGVTSLPVVITRSDVCRDELLFELEMDAVAALTK